MSWASSRPRITTSLCPPKRISSATAACPDSDPRAAFERDSRGCCKMTLGNNGLSVYKVHLVLAKALLLSSLLALSLYSSRDLRTITASETFSHQGHEDDRKRKKGKSYFVSNVPIKSSLPVSPLYSGVTLFEERRRFRLAALTATGLVAFKVQGLHRRP